MKPVFFLRHFNDIDHISPVIWRCLERGDEILVVLLDRNYPARFDNRLSFLRRYDTCNVMWIDEFLGLNWGGPLFELAPNDGRAPEQTVYRYLRYALQKSGISDGWAVKALREHDVSACVFEWGPPHRPSHAELFNAATTLELPTICLPHGLNIYTNTDIKPGRKQALDEGRQIMSSRNEYDAYVSQSQYHRKQDITFGVNPESYHVLGSARYYPEWQSRNEELYDTFAATGADTERLKVVFMLPHWEYNVDKETTLDLISHLVDEEWIYLTVKEHTRGDSLPQSVDDRLVRTGTAEILAAVPSVSLIKWADAVINFGSSIGIEAFLQDTHHVNPSYLHSNTTIFDETGAGYCPESNTETVELLRDIQETNRETVDEESKTALYRAVIYGGQAEYDVLSKYRNLLREFSTE